MCICTCNIRCTYISRRDEFFICYMYMVCFLPNSNDNLRVPFCSELSKNELICNIRFLWIWQKSKWFIWDRKPGRSIFYAHYMIKGDHHVVMLFSYYFTVECYQKCVLHRHLTTNPTLTFQTWQPSVALVDCCGDARVSSCRARSPAMPGVWAWLPEAPSTRSAWKSALTRREKLPCWVGVRNVSTSNTRRLSFHL